MLARRFTRLALIAGLLGATIETSQARAFWDFSPAHHGRKRSKPARPPAAPVWLPVPIPRPRAEPGPAPETTPTVKPAPAAPEPTPKPPVEPPNVLPVPPEAPKEMPKPPTPEPLPSKTPATPTAPAPLPQAPSPPASPAVPPPHAPSVAAPGPARQPAADSGCLGRLQASNVSAAPITLPPQPDARCTVVDAVKLTSLKLPDGAEVLFPDGPTLACVTADTFAAYVRELLSPLAKGSYGAPIGKVWTGPGLECRSRDHIVGAKLSAHGQGLAVDIAQMALTDGRTIAVGVPKSDADRAFETAARAAGCGYFHTTLGPGSDPYHKTHWHFDLEPRGSKGDGKFCQ